MAEEVSEAMSKTLGVKYIKVKDVYVTETGVVFTLDEAKNKKADWLKAEYMKRLTNSDLVDYTFAKSTGAIRRHKDQEILKERAEKIVSKMKEFRIPTFDVVTVIRLFALALSTVAGILSFSYTREYFLRSNGPARSSMLSGIIVAFSLMAFDLVVYFVAQALVKGITKSVRAMYIFVAFVMLNLWLVAMGFSMYSTVDVNYTNYQKAEMVRVQSGASEQSGSMVLSAAASGLEAKRKAAESAAAALAAAIAKEGTPTWLISQLSKASDTAAKEFNKADEEYKALASTSTSSTVIEEKKVASRDLFDAIAESYKIDRFKLYFSVNTLPAVFLDLIAPLMLAVASFLGGKRNGQEEKGI